MIEPTQEQVESAMRAILASVPDGVVGVHHATIYATAALRDVLNQSATE